MNEDDLKKLGLRLRPRKVNVTNDTAAKAGKVGFDDRGNAQFEWSEELAADGESGERKRKKALSHPGLSLVDEEQPANAPIRQNPKGLRMGYNPYESGMLSGRQSKPKRDLRELSKWIEQKRKLNDNKPDEE